MAFYTVIFTKGQFKYFDKMDTSIGLNKNLYWFLKMSLCWAVLFAIFHVGKVRTYGRNIKYWRWLQNRSLILSNTISKWSHLHSCRFLWTSKQYLRATRKFYCFSTVLERSFSNFDTYIGVGTWSTPEFNNVLTRVRPFRLKFFIAYKRNKAKLDPFHMCFTISL
jgi:hypothetical protein